MQALCEIFLCVVKKSGSKFKNLDPFCKTFEYEYVRFECLYFGKPNQAKTDNSRPNQKTNKIDCEFYYRLKFNKAENYENYENNIIQLNESVNECKIVE